MLSDIPAETTVEYSNGATTTITYTWAVTGLRTTHQGAFQNAVIQTFWTLTGTDSAGNQATFVGATPFSTAGLPVDYGFVEFSQLTEADVLGWIQRQVTGSYAQHITGYIYEKLNGQTTEIIQPPLPWVAQDPVQE
jgi:hypothetical protein